MPLGAGENQNIWRGYESLSQSSGLVRVCEERSLGYSFMSVEHLLLYPEP